MPNPEMHPEDRKQVLAVSVEPTIDTRLTKLKDQGYKKSPIVNQALREFLPRFAKMSKQEKTRLGLIKK